LFNESSHESEKQFDFLWGNLSLQTYLLNVLLELRLVSRVGGNGFQQMLFLQVAKGLAGLLEALRGVVHHELQIEFLGLDYH
jgi:hypothetical protein